MSRKNDNTYEYKEAPMRQALEYSAFGWLIGKRSQHYSKKLNKEVVTLRRDYLISTNPVIVDCEKEFFKLEKGRIPVKYRSHVFLSFIGKVLVIMLTIAFLVAGIGLLATGVYDAFKIGKRSWAIYNAAVETELISDPLYIEEGNAGATIPKGYYSFIADNPELNTFGELNIFNKDKVDEDRLLQSYKGWLVEFDLVKEGDEDGFVKVDATVVPDDEGNYPVDTEIFVFGVIRSLVASMGVNAFFVGLPIWLNACDILGCALLLIFIIMVVIEAAVGKKKKRQKRIRCAQLKSDCLKVAADALRQMKSENRELMTKKDMQLSDLETMFSQVMESHSDDYD